MEIYKSSQFMIFHDVHFLAMLVETNRVPQKHGSMKHMTFTSEKSNIENEIVDPKSTQSSSKPWVEFFPILPAVTLPETNSKFAPENRPKLNRKGSYSNHPFLGAFAVSFREGTSWSLTKLVHLGFADPTTMDSWDPGMEGTRVPNMAPCLNAPKGSRIIFLCHPFFGQTNSLLVLGRIDLKASIYFWEAKYFVRSSIHSDRNFQVVFQRSHHHRSRCPSNQTSLLDTKKSLEL